MVHETTTHLQLSLVNVIQGLRWRQVDQLCLEAKAADPSPDPQCQVGSSTKQSPRFYGTSWFHEKPWDFPWFTMGDNQQ